MSQVKKAAEIISKVPARTKLIILVVIAVVFSIAFPLISSFSGKAFGTQVGVAVGSFQAVTEDMPAAYQQGKKDGLSAEDTSVEMQGRLHEVGKLDVLVAHVKLNDEMKMGEKFAAILDVGADVIFAVDLSESKVVIDGKTISIILPKPEVEINIDSTKIKMLDYYQRGLFPGTTKDGLDATINTLDKLEKNAKESIEEYGTYEKTAEENAVKEIKALVGMVAGKDMEVIVSFEEKAGESK